MNLHDALLTSVRIAENKDIILSGQSVDGREFEILLVSPKDFLCNNFKEGNTIFGIYDVPEERAIKEGLLDLLMLKWTEGNDYLDNILSQIRTRELVFFTLESSYGAEIWALCKNYTVTLK